VLTYLIEAYVAGAKAADLGLRAQRTAEAMASEGHEIRYLRSVFIPADETCFHFVEAAWEETVAELARRAELGYERIVEGSLLERTAKAGVPPTPNPEAIFQLGLAFWGSKTLLSAVELGVFTELARGPLDAEELADRLGLHARSACDFLDALVALGMLRRTGATYANTTESDLFLDRGKSSYIGGMLEMANARLYPFWGRLTAALQTGEPQNEARTGGDFFGALYGDPGRLRQFLHAMTGLSASAAAAIAERFPFAGYGSVLDLGCAEGGLLVQLALVHPHLRGLGFDLPAVRCAYDDYVRSFGLEDRLEFHAGDFFRDPLPEADVVTLGHILHDWGLDEKRHLLRKAYEALLPGGALIVFDSIIDDERRENAFGLLMSLNMLIETPSGFDYTGADCQRWMREIGFVDTKVAHLSGPDSMVVGIK
jgi:SAM-dependent methyltransferase